MVQISKWNYENPVFLKCPVIVNFNHTVSVFKIDVFIHMYMHKYLPLYDIDNLFTYIFFV